MLRTRLVYLLVVFSNVLIDGLAFVDSTNLYATSGELIPFALLFNLIVWPVAIFAAYRMGGMTEEIYRNTVPDAVLGSAVNQHPGRQARQAAGDIRTEPRGE